MTQGVTLGGVNVATPSRGAAALELTQAMAGTEITPRG